MKCQIENLKRNNSGMNKTNTMNRIRIHLILFSLLMAGITCYSQSPNLISYQTVIRNGNNELVSNTTIGVRISILGGPEANVLVYQEEHTVKTNINGLAYLTIGNGKILNGLITSIDWSKGPYFIKSETDPTGGKNYTIVVLSQMLSVPYAIYSSTAERITGTIPEKDPLFNGSIAKGITATDTSYWNRKLNTSDTSRMLSNYLKKSEAITTGGVETDPVFNGSIAKGITATDTSYWNKKLNTSDTSGMLANYRTSLNQKLNITDTAKMLTPYLRDADTTNMLANYRTSINNKLDAKDTTLMLSNYLKKSDAVNSSGIETDPLFNGSIAKGITATDTSYWNRKLNSTDTSGMLANYRTSINNKLDAKDTTLMLSNYLKKSETINESDPLFNGSIAKGITATDTSYWNKKLSVSDTIGMLTGIQNKLDTTAFKINSLLSKVGTGLRIGFDKNTTWTCPEGINSIIIELWGGGGVKGADAGCPPAYGNNFLGHTHYGGVGGKGGYLKDTISVQPGKSYNIIIGNHLENSKKTYFDTHYAEGGENGQSGFCLAHASGGTAPKGNDGSIIGYINTSLVVPNYIPISYITNTSPNCCANPGEKGFVIIQF